MRRVLTGFRLSLGFLTVVPVGTIRGDVGPADLARSRYFYPIVGLLIGGVLALASLGLSRLGAGNGPTAWGLIAVGVALTGGLHLDGLADTFDGLFLTGGTERRLSVMRDPHVGSHGVAAVVLLILGEFAALQAMSDSRRALALLGAAATSRTLLLVVAGSGRYARPEGTGRAIIEAATRRDAAVACLLTPILGWSTCGLRGLWGGCAAVVLALGITALGHRRIGGITGDLLGAAVELGGLAFLLAV